MKFLITSGKKKGFTFDVIEAEVKIGRHKDNDLVLEDESVSALHARIRPEGGRFWIEDCNSSKGIEVNGKPVKQSFLERGDAFTIGAIQITAVDEYKLENGGPKREEIRVDPFVVKLAKESALPRSSKGIVGWVFVLLVLVGACVMHCSISRILPLASVPSVPPLKDELFQISYEKIQASNQNVFRYAMWIEDDELTITVDDLKQGRRIRRSKKIKRDQVEGLRREIKIEDILSLPPLTEGKSQDTWSSYTLNFLSSKGAHSIQVINRVLPDNFKRICSSLEKLDEMELGVITELMEELKKHAEDAHQKARKLYEERFVKADNLYHSAKAYSETIWCLDSVEPKPPIYEDAIHGRQVALDELNQLIKGDQSEVMRARQMKDWKGARNALMSILEKLPDSSDLRHQEARELLLDTERRIRSK